MSSINVSIAAEVSQFGCNCNGAYSAALQTATSRPFAGEDKHRAKDPPAELPGLAASGHAAGPAHVYRAVLFVRLISARRLAGGPSAISVSRARTDAEAAAAPPQSYVTFTPKYGRLIRPFALCMRLMASAKPF